MIQLISFWSTAILVILFMLLLCRSRPNNRICHLQFGHKPAWLMFMDGDVKEVDTRGHGPCETHKETAHCLEKMSHFLWGHQERILSIRYGLCGYEENERIRFLVVFYGTVVNYVFLGTTFDVPYWACQISCTVYKMIKTKRGKLYYIQLMNGGYIHGCKVQVTLSILFLSPLKMNLLHYLHS